MNRNADGGLCTVTDRWLNRIPYERAKWEYEIKRQRNNNQLGWYLEEELE